MQKITTIRLEKEEEEILSESRMFLSVLKEVADQDKVDQAIAALDCVISSNLHFNSEKFDIVQEAFAAVLDILETRKEAQADPKWVEDTKRMIEDGHIPLCINPEQCVQVVREIAKRGFKVVTEAYRVVWQVRDEVIAAEKGIQLIDVTDVSYYHRDCE